jgi:hypothetical protein
MNVQLLELSDLRKYLDTINPQSDMAEENLKAARILLEKSISRHMMLTVLARSLADPRIVGGKGSKKYRRMANETARKEMC